MMEKPFKIFIATIIILLLISLFVTYRASKITIKSGEISPPYVKVLNGTAENGKLTFELEIVNAGFNISISGGYAEILNTGQKENISPTDSLLFNVSFPITGNLTQLNEVTLDGVVSGRMDGNSIYITFSNPVPIKIVNVIRLINFTYFNSNLTLYLEVDNVINISLLDIKSLSLINANLSEILAILPSIPLNISLPPGIHYLKLSFNLEGIEGAKIYYPSTQAHYYYYVTADLDSIVYLVPPQNLTYSLYYIRQN